MRKHQWTMFDAVVCVALLIIALICLIPLLNTVALSLSDKTSAAGGRVTVWPINFTVEPYREMLKDRQYWGSFAISVMRVIAGMSLNVALSVLMAYPLSKRQSSFHSKNVYLYIMIFTMMFSGGLVANYMWIKTLGLLDSFWVLVLPGAVPVFNVILLMNFFKGIPEVLEEASAIDGANPYTTLFRVFLPMSLPGVATIALFSIVNHWNAYFDGMIYINTAKKVPLQTYIQALNIELKAEQMVNMTPEEIIRSLEVSNITFNCAKAVVCTIPVLLVYPFLQRYFVTGLVMGAVKE